LKGKWFVGMQVHAHDLKDEGAETVLKNMHEKAHVTNVFPTANYIEERHPYPRGTLPHNPKRSVYFSKGGLYFEFQNHYYEKTKLRPLRTTEEGMTEFDALKATTEAAGSLGMNVFPWIIALNDPVVASTYPTHNMIDVFGNRVSGWLCPNSRDVRNYLVGIVKNILGEYEVSGLFLDRIRYPIRISRENDFGDAFSCFCRNCQRQAREKRLDLLHIRNELRKILKVAKTKLLTVVETYDSIRTGCLDVAKFFIDNDDLAEWIQFRQSSINDLVEEVQFSARATNDRVEFCLDLWPPSYSWLLGQNYRNLGRLCDSLKLFPYHKLGGGVDISALFDELRGIIPNLEVDKCLRLFYRFFGFRGPKNLTQFRTEGFPSDFVYNETLKAMGEIQKQIDVYVGVQLWNITRAEIEETLAKIAKANPTGFIYYCYGWAPFENFETAGSFVKNV